MVGAGILQMLNPVNLIAIATIAAGAAFFQWLTSSETEVKSLDDAIGDLESSVKALRDSAKVSAEDLKKDFGSVTPEIVRLNQELSGLAHAEAVQALKDAFAALKGEVEGEWFAFDTGQVAKLLDVAQARANGQGCIKGGTNPIITDFQATLRALNDAPGPTRQLEVLGQLKAEFISATGGLEQMNPSQRACYHNILASERALRSMSAAQEEAERTQRDLARSVGNENDRMGAKMPDTGKDIVVARAFNAELKEQSNLRRLIAGFGEDSVQVAQARSAATDAVKNLGKALLDAALQAVWLGTGPLAAPFGFTTSALSLLFPAAAPVVAARAGGYVPGFAGGGDPVQAVVLGREAARAPIRPPMRSLGLQTGPGGPREVLLHVRVSPGKYIVNGASTARYRPLLERINAGADIPGYAVGGLAGGASGLAARASDAGGRQGGQDGALIVNVYLDGAKGSAGNTPLVYLTCFNKAGLLVTAAIDEIRRVIDPVTNARRGYLMEPVRTNLFLRSQEFELSPWATFRATPGVTVLAERPYDGSGTADAVYAAQFADPVAKAHYDTVYPRLPQPIEGIAGEMFTPPERFGAMSEAFRKERNQHHGMSPAEVGIFRPDDGMACRGSAINVSR